MSAQPLLVVWEVLGHLDLLLDASAITERVTDDGSTYGVADSAISDIASPLEPPGGGAPVPIDRHGPDNPTR